MKKLLTLVLALLMAFSALSALAAGEVRTDFSEYPTLNARFIHHSLIDTMPAKNEDYQYNRITNAHREASGINIQLTHALVDGTEETNKQAMILASGDVPDLMQMSLANYMQWGAQGMFLSTEDYLKDMPNYMALVPEVSREVCRIGGVLYAFPGSHEESEMKGGNGIAVRYDVFKTLGIEEPQTADEYFEMWKLVKDTTEMIPLTGKSNPTVKAAFGVLSNTVQLEDGSYTFSWATEAFRDYLAYMNKLYVEGLLDAEYVSMDTATLQERYVSGKAFSSSEGWASLVVTINGVFTSVEGSELQYLPQMTKDENVPAQLTEIFPVQRFNVIPVGAKNPDLAAQWIEYMCTPEAKKIQDYGIEGVDYTLDADGKVVQTLDEQNFVGWKIAYEYIPTPDSFKVRLYAKGFDWAFNGLLAAREQSNVEVVRDMTSFLPAYDEYLELNTQLGLKSYSDEQADKFIMGERSMDEFDAYIAELEQRGLGQFVAVLNDWVKLYE